MVKFKKIGIFWWVYIFFVILLAVCVFYGLRQLEAFLIDYEHTRPSYIMDELTDALNGGDYTHLIANSQTVSDGLLSGRDMRDILSSLIGHETVTYKKTYSADRISNPSFSLLVGDTTLASAHLTLTGEKSKYNQDIYKLDAITDIYGEDEERIIEVPEGFNVLVNGMMLGDKWIASRKEDVFDTNHMIDKNIGKALLTYKLCVYADPITVLSPDGAEVSATTDSAGTITVKLESVSIRAPSSAKVGVNGVEISKGGWLAKTPEGFGVLARIPDKYFGSEGKPSVSEYLVTGLSSVPLVEVTHDTLPLKVEQDGNVYTAEYIWPNIDKNAYLSMALEFARLHARTASNDYGKSAYMSKILRDTPLYHELQIGLRPEFYTSHTQYWFEDEKAENLIVYGDNCFSADVSLVHCISGIRTRPNDVERFSFSANLCFVRSSGVWYLADWTLVE